MKRSLLPILCCPTCKGDLELRVKMENEREIVEGSLYCSACSVEYPIEDGIPDLLPRAIREK
ncbi:MAG TPA: methytransferase partner Trm112 [Methanoregulaceae archaeon]|nr:methytransferase partner Trm112 [Methanoregulaceae archaeon]